MLPLIICCETFLKLYMVFIFRIHRTVGLTFPVNFTLALCIQPQLPIMFSLVKKTFKIKIGTFYFFLLKFFLDPFKYFPVYIVFN